jgi:phage terminase small subunit
MTEDQEPGESPSKPKLTRRQQKFIDEYLVDLNGTQAAIRAGYAETSAGAEASRLLKNVNIALAIDIAMATSPGITRTRIVNELAKIAFAQPRDYFEWGPDGVTVRDCADLTDDQAAVISEVSQTITESGGTIRVKLSDKQSALEKLGKVLGMFRERHEHTGPGGGPIQTESIDRPEKETREDWLARRRRELGAVAPLGASTWPAN